MRKDFRKMIKGQRNSTFNLINYALCLFLFSFSGCKKDLVPILPGDKTSVAFNFYSTSDVMLMAYGPSKSSTMVWLDKLQSASPPILYYGFVGGNEFPEPTLGSTSINYIRYNSGNHRLMFTDTATTIVLDTTISVPEKSFTSLYFADALTAYNAPAVYQMVAVQEPRSVKEDKMGVRFVHLSPDAGSLVCNRQQADGTLTNALPADLHFKEASTYQYFDSGDAVDGLLKFSLNNPVNRASIITGVPYTPGRSYVIVIIGFFNDQQRLVASGKNGDGSIKFKSIAIARNLRAVARISY